MHTMNVRRNLRRRGAQVGFTLLETLVAIVIFSIGLLGVVALQARTVQLSVDGEDRNRAALLADEVVATMWAQGTTSLGTTETTAWSTRVGNSLPGATATVSAPDADGVVTVSISWRPPSRRTGDPDSTYSTKLAIPL
jgi:type IV pilus assembly protein PilV